ncbi:helix-turn-helix domain-containing protein [Ignatzschineria rhizosphaerae]|uniref:Helix-turn-helix domain-containing protein n=1 Tax=Ignatzschineria rhizosphaerae TaxID=2923279 RepID=A0ABY3WZ62_9GAMM|nr:YdaS family helix-turn-helix protein [Ignatzschineria rhizosphaerae]UNM95919.1 helix-turn-helix domain-containing protein [Ignatzschineria rhizosphaerae]
MKYVLIEAIKKAGGQTVLAKKLGVAQCTISHWVHRNQVAPPAEHVPMIEELTGVSRHKLRPDVFGEEKKEA